jgi:hypothetical protein
MWGQNTFLNNPESLRNKLSRFSYMQQSRDVTNPHVRRNIYFSRFNAFLRCGLILWDNGVES